MSNATAIGFNSNGNLMRLRNRLGTDLTADEPITSAELEAIQATLGATSSIVELCELNLNNYEPVGDGSADDTDAIEAACLAIQSTTLKQILFPAGTYRITRDVTLPTGCAVRFVRGAKISVDSGKTLTVNGTIHAGHYQIFSGSGSVLLAGDVKVSVVQWFGALADGVTDDAAAIQKAVSASAMIGPLVYFPVGNYLVKSSITLPRRGRYLGDGRDRTFIFFAPLTAASPFTSLFVMPQNSDNVHFQDLSLQNALTSGGIRTSGLRKTPGGTACTHIYLRSVEFGKFTEYGFESDDTYYFQAIDCRFWRNNNIATYGGTDTTSAVDFRIGNNGNAILIIGCQFHFSDRFIELPYGYTAHITGSCTFEQAGTITRSGWTAGSFIEIGDTRYAGLNITENYFEGCLTSDADHPIIQIHNARAPRIVGNLFLGAYGASTRTHTCIDFDGEVLNAVVESNYFEDCLYKFLTSSGGSYIAARDNTFVVGGVAKTSKDDIIPYIEVPYVLVDGFEIFRAGVGGPDSFYNSTTVFSTNTDTYCEAVIRHVSESEDPVEPLFGLGVRYELERSEGSVGVCGAYRFEWNPQSLEGTEDCDFVLSLSVDSMLTERLRVTSTGQIRAATLRLTALPVYANNAAAITGGLVVNDFYRTSAGVVMQVI